ncbi:MAG: iron-containing redox enzyme family protein [Acidobacteria bacterium]|nr:iron-containing redox enzyme family protein [Acidobacteriota bacterium]
MRELFVVSRGGIPLMEAVRDEASRREGNAARVVADYLSKHVEEERGHCEWVLDDLEALGFDRAIESKRALSIHASSLLGCAYTWSFESHPAAILGFLVVFEGDPMAVDFLESVALLHDMPKEAFGFYLDHARIDPAHSADIFDAIDRVVACDAELEAPISLCALHTLHMTEAILLNFLAV